MSKDFSEELGLLAEEKNAAESSIALNKILAKLLSESRKRELRLWGVIIFLVAVIAASIILFFAYESQYETGTIEADNGAELTYSEVEGISPSINNVSGDQYNDNAAHYDGKTEE